MQTEILSVTSPQAISRALEILHSGGSVAFPTDTVYGLGALAFDAEAVERLYIAKERPEEKAIPILLGSVEDLPRVAASVPQMAQILAACFWPGALTLVIPKHPSLPQAISPLPTVGVRVPAHSAARALLQAAGPLAVTSANLSGHPGPRTAGEVFEQLGGRIPLILDGGRTPGGRASTVVDCLGPEPKILRPGPVSGEDIFRCLGFQG